MSTNDQVQHLWANHQAGDSNNLHSDGTVLKSYTTPIAVWHGDVAFISSNGMSPTTASKHLSGLGSAVRGEKFYTPAFGYYDRTPPSAAKCIIEAAEEMSEQLNKISRMRTYVTESIERYEARRAQILDLARRFDVADLPEMPPATGDLKERAKELKVKEKQKRADDLRRREERQRAERIIDQGQLDLWLQQGRGHYPQSFRTRGADQITIKAAPQELHDGVPVSGTVITSQGAEAPLAHVVKALAFYDSRMIRKEIGSTHNYSVTFTPYHTNGHKIALGAFTLDSIDEQGNVRAGCHTISAQEIARFRKQWRL